MSPTGVPQNKCPECEVVLPATKLGKELLEVHHAVNHPNLEWRSQAACRGMDTRIFFPDKGGTPPPKGELSQAKKVCATCPVKTECFLESNHAFSNRCGIWGGMTASERQAKRRRLHITPATEILEDWLFDIHGEPRRLMR